MHKLGISLIFVRKLQLTIQAKKPKPDISYRLIKINDYVYSCYSIFIHLLILEFLDILLHESNCVLLEPI